MICQRSQNTTDGRNLNINDIRVSQTDTILIQPSWSCCFSDIFYYLFFIIIIFILNCWLQSYEPLFLLFTSSIKTQKLHWIQFPKILREFICMLRTYINALKFFLMNLRLVILQCKSSVRPLETYIEDIKTLSCSLLSNILWNS